VLSSTVERLLESIVVVHVLKTKATVVFPVHMDLVVLIRRHAIFVIDLTRKCTTSYPN